MKLSFISLCALSVACCTSLFGEAVPATEFPKEISFQGDGKDYKLQLTGVAARKKFLVKVYNLGSYVQDAATVAKSSNKFDDILESDKAKQLTMRWDRDVTAQQAQDAFRESVKKVFTESQQGQLKSQIDSFIAFFNNGAKKGDEYVLRWLPEGKVEFIANGQADGSATSKEFAKGLWSIWLGEHSVVDRNGLISQIK